MGNKIDHANTYRLSTDGYDFVDVDCETFFCTQTWLMYFVCDQAGVGKCERYYMLNPQGLGLSKVI